MNKPTKRVCYSFSLLISAATLAYAQSPPSLSWLQATATTRADIASVQEDINKQESQQAETQDMRQIKLQDTLNLMAAQQKAILENTRHAGSESDVPEFRPRPRGATNSNNPWLKKNPWGNTEKNPYSGQKYKPNTTNSEGDGIYVKPKTNNGQPSKPVNIFR